MTSINFMSKFVDNNTVTGGPKLSNRLRQAENQLLRLRKFYSALKDFLKLKLNYSFLINYKK